MIQRDDAFNFSLIKIALCISGLLNNELKISLCNEKVLIKLYYILQLATHSGFAQMPFVV